ncbi:MAG TPA: DUF4383 domain-containing protein [Micromonosporaceae bacterium]
MAHIPVNHPLRPLYRVISAVIGLYVLVFGLLGVIETNGGPAFGKDGAAWVLGLRTNLAFSVISIIWGAVIFVAAIYGRNLFHYLAMLAGVVFMLNGFLMMALMQTSANVFAFSMVNCIVSFVFGMAVLASGLYSKVGTDEEAEAARRWQLTGGM